MAGLSMSMRVLGVAVLLQGGAYAGSFDAVPSSALSPQEVVRFQMEALRDNDADDNGIATTFRFASPANKQVTGPLPRFIRMIKYSPYRVMLDTQLIEYGQVQVVEDHAQLRVSVLTREYLAVSFRFYLSRQADGECRGCWMTDAVMVEDMRMLPGVES